MAIADINAIMQQKMATSTTSKVTSPKPASPTFQKIFNIPTPPKPKPVVKEPPAPFIRPEIRPPVVYDVPIPRYIHPEETIVKVTTKGGQTKEVTEIIPGYEEIVTRRQDETGEFIEVKDVVTGAIDKFYEDKTILGEGSKRSYSETGEVIFKTLEEVAIIPGGWEIEPRDLGNIKLPEFPDILGGITGGITKTIIIIVAVIGGIYLIGKFLAGRK